MARDVECKPPDLAVVMLPAEPVYCWPTPQEALPAWESRFFNDENGSRVGERLHRIIPHDVTQHIGIPPAAVKDPVHARCIGAPSCGRARSRGRSPIPTHPAPPDPRSEERRVGTERGSKVRNRWRP